MVVVVGKLVMALFQMYSKLLVKRLYLHLSREASLGDRDTKPLLKL